MVELVTASHIVDAALKHGRGLKLKPLTVAVLDPGGFLVAFKREDGSSLLRQDIAHAKAWGALGMGAGSRMIAERAAAAPAFFTALTALAQGRVIPAPGGVLIRTSEGALLGAVGISGDLPEQDEACAVAGIEASGLIADTGAPSK